MLMMRMVVLVPMLALLSAQLRTTFDEMFMTLLACRLKTHPKCCMEAPQVFQCLLLILHLFVLIVYNLFGFMVPIWPRLRSNAAAAVE